MYSCISDQLAYAYWLPLDVRLNTSQSMEFSYFYLQYNGIFFFAYD